MSDKMFSDYELNTHERHQKKNKKTPSQLSLNEVRQLIDIFDNTPSIGEMSWKGFNIKRHAVSTLTAPPVFGSSTVPAAQTIDHNIKSDNNEQDTSTKKLGTTVNSPMVGTCYLASSPETDNFVKVGQKVSVGDTLCLIEAMKMFNKIKADISGTIVKKLIEDGQAVEFDQPLFEIDESGV